MTVTRPPASADGVTQLLAEPRFELMPFDSFAGEMDHLPEGATIAITTSPQLGLDATVEWTERAAARGFDVSPHVAARYVRDEGHLDDIARRLTDAGVTDIFVPGGDREDPIGRFDSAYALLDALSELDYEFDEVGITGYPEGHALLDDATLADAMQRKAPYATYIVTQLCYDPETVVEWVEAVRERGVDLPVEVGIPGVMNYEKLLDISRKVGVGDSVKFIQKTTGLLGFVRELIGSRGTYTPDDLVAGLAPYADDPDYGIQGLHVYTFNRTEDTESWRYGVLDE